MEFSIDWIWKEPWVKTECQTWADQFAQEGLKQHGGMRLGDGPKSVPKGSSAEKLVG